MEGYTYSPVQSSHSLSLAQEKEETSDSTNDDNDNEVKEIKTKLDFSNFFKTFCKNILSIRPSNLPGAPSSFKAFLDSVLPYSINFSDSRVEVYSDSKSKHSYKDLKINAVVATCFPLFFNLGRRHVSPVNEQPNGLVSWPLSQRKHNVNNTQLTILIMK